MNTLRSSFDELGHATWSLDLAVAGLLFVGTVLPMALFGYGNDVILALLLGTAMCAAVVLRRRNPMLALALVTVFCLLHVVVLPYPTPLEELEIVQRMGVKPPVAQQVLTLEQVAGLKGAWRGWCLFHQVKHQYDGASGLHAEACFVALAHDVGHEGPHVGLGGLQQHCTTRRDDPGERRGAEQDVGEVTGGDASQHLVDHRLELLGPRRLRDPGDDLGGAVGEHDPTETSDLVDIDWLVCADPIESFPQSRWKLGGSCGESVCRSVNHN